MRLSRCQRLTHGGNMIDAGLIVSATFILAIFSKIIYDSFWG